MQGLLVVSMNDPKVQEAKERFERNYRRTLRTPPLSFEEFLELFKADCKTFLGIGRTLGMHHHAILKIYRKYFADLILNRPDGKSRRRMCTLKRYKSAAKELPENRELRKVAKLSTAHGYSFEQVRLRGSGLEFKKRALLINQKPCFIRFVRKATRLNVKSESGPHKYGRVVLKSLNVLSSYDFLIIIRAIPGYPEGIFIIPVSDLIDAYSGLTTYPQLLVPAKIRNRSPRKLPWKQYENAWHLLKSEQ